MFQTNGMADLMQKHSGAIRAGGESKITRISIIEVGKYERAFAAIGWQFRITGAAFGILIIRAKTDLTSIAADT